MFLGQKMVAEGETDANKIVAAMTEHIQAQPLAKIDYVSAVDGVTMDPVDPDRRDRAGGHGRIHRQDETH